MADSAAVGGAAAAAAPALSSSPQVVLAGYGPAVAVAKLDEEGGASVLSVVASTGGFAEPSYVAVDAARRLLFAVAEGEGRVGSWRMADDGSLTPVSTVSAEGEAPCHLALHPSGDWLLVSNYTTGTLTTLAVDAATGALRVHDSFSPGHNVHEAVWRDGGRRVYVPCLGSDYVAQLEFDAATGTLTPNAAAPTAPLPRGAGPRHITFSAAGTHTYVINELDCTMTRFVVDATTGVLTDPVTVSTLPPGTLRGAASTAHLELSPDGAFLYGSNRGHNTLVTWRVAPADGTLEPVGWETGGGRVARPRDFALTPSGRHLLCANQDGDTVTVFSRDASTGALAVVQDLHLGAGSKPCCVAFIV